MICSCIELVDWAVCIWGEPSADFLFSSFIFWIIHSLWNSPYFKMVDVRRATITRQPTTRRKKKIIQFFSWICKWIFVIHWSRKSVELSYIRKEENDTWNKIFLETFISTIVSAISLSFKVNERIIAKCCEFAIEYDPC